MTGWVPGSPCSGPPVPATPRWRRWQDRARRRGIPLAVLRAPPDYPWGREFLLVRPDQHIAWRARDAAQIDLDLVTGHLITGEPVTGDRGPARPEPNGGDGMSSTEPGRPGRARPGRPP